MRIQVKDGRAVAEEAFWLAWNACGGPLAMGVFRDKPDASKADVVRNIQSSGDYPMKIGDNRPDSLYADYVFGRMVKLGIAYGPDWVEVANVQPRPDYQGWARKYPTYESLVRAASARLEGAHVA